MQNKKFDFDIELERHQDVPWPDSAEDSVDRFGIRTALILLCIAFFVAAVWFMSMPSFEKCSALANVTDRNICYDGLRKELLKPPIKGAAIPGN
jgi:hypothetical protein